MSKAKEIAKEEDEIFKSLSGARFFSLGTRPVIRWAKGDGLDDNVVRLAIGIATRIFGNEVDYCLCTNHINANRARRILELATEPVEWISVSPEHNKILAEHLEKAKCHAENYGYWWKWFPERVRMNAPAFILDGDMIITAKPSWYEQWKSGNDKIRVSQDNRARLLEDGIYGSYYRFIDENIRLYSGLVSIPPKQKYMNVVSEILTTAPLKENHNGKIDMDEQGVISYAFQKLKAAPIPLYEFPFARAYEGVWDFGAEGDENKVWGVHFGNSFIRENKHFIEFAKKYDFSHSMIPVENRFDWLKNAGQWGICGWSMPEENSAMIYQHALKFSGKQILELGTSRGRLTAMLASSGSYITTIDKYDRGAKQNLDGMNVKVIIDDAVNFLNNSSGHYDLIIVDLHDNSIEVWEKLWNLIHPKMAQGGEVILSNALLYKVVGWEEEVGVYWILQHIKDDFQYEIYDKSIPSFVVVKRKE